MSEYRGENNKNKHYPQTPKKDIAKSDQDLEVAKEMDEMYELKSRIGYSPTKVVRKDK
ncbi:YfhD family protein [Evansella sp. AB-rgal1]|uniref:YfhD family protein n=1 Tax=Evansella sp. AB-rgal1 TaxID=3242696 RepID=UPI00359D5455